MASFFERNKRKSALALLLLFLKWRKGLAPLLLIVALLMLFSFAPGNLMGICLSGLARLPGGAHVAAVVTWSASKVGLEVGGIPHQSAYRDYVAAFRLAGEQGFAGLLQKRSFKELIDAFHAARYDRNAALNLLFHNTGGSAKPGSGLDMVKGNVNEGTAPVKVAGGKSVAGVATPDEAKDVAERGVSLDEADLEGERAGMVESAFAAGELGKLSPDQLLGGSGAFASKAFFSGGPGAFGSAGKRGPDGKNIDKFKNGNSAKGGGARLSQTSRRGGRSMNLGRRGMRYSRALGTLRGMVTLNDTMRNGTTLEQAAGGATEQWEGSPLTGSQAQLPPTPPALSGTTGGGFGGVPGGYPGGNYPGGGNIPTYTAADPGLICTSLQLAQGMVSDGTHCVNPTNANPNNFTPWQDKTNEAINDIMAGLGLAIAAAIVITIGKALWDVNSPCVKAAGAVVIAIGIGIMIGAIAKAIEAMKLGIDIASDQTGGGFQGSLIFVTALSEIGVFALLAGMAFTAGQMSIPTVLGAAAIVFLIGFLLLALTEALGGGAPQMPQIDNPIEDEKERRLKANADDGSADGLPPPPPDMHYETGPDGKKVLAYNYNTFPPGEQPPVNVAQELNSQKGGGDTGLPPAPAGQHYEGLDKDGKPKLVPDYPIGVAQKEDANNFKGGPPTKLPPAPSGQHYELTNSGGDPTDPKSWKLVNDYPISNADLQKANADKGQTNSQCHSHGPAPEGMHYEGYDCHLVKDYPLN